jgi:nicotinamidase-related amidase
MSTSATALLVVDVQESFRHRPYWCDSELPLFVECLQALIAGAQARKIPVIQIFHVEDSGPFSLESGYVVPLRDLSFTPDAVFHKRSHSALVGSGLAVWLTQTRHPACNCLRHPNRTVLRDNDAPRFRSWISS